MYLILALIGAISGALIARKRKGKVTDTFCTMPLFMPLLLGYWAHPDRYRRSYNHLGRNVFAIF